MRSQIEGSIQGFRSSGAGHFVEALLELESLLSSPAFLVDLLGLVVAGDGGGTAALQWYHYPMAIAYSKLTAQGETSVPDEVRRKLGVGPDSVLEWEEEGER